MSTGPLFTLFAAAIVSTATAETGADLAAQYREAPDTHPLIPNVSYAGYRAGEMAPPDVPVVVNLRDFGGKGDGKTDNRDAFRQAIEAAWIKGGGAVEIPDGTYVVDGMILLDRDGVVLRGESRDGTTIKFSKPLGDILGAPGHGSSPWNWSGGLLWIGPGDRFLIDANGTWKHDKTPPDGLRIGSAWELVSAESKLATVKGKPVRGEKVITVDGADRLKPGMLVNMVWNNPPDNSLWQDIGQDESFQDYEFGQWLTDPNRRPRLFWTVEIAAVNGDQVTLKQPLRVDVRPEWEVTIFDPGALITDAGVENLTIALDARAELGHNAGLGWNGIFLNRAWNCWVRNVTVENGECGIHVSGSKNVSLLDTKITGDRPMHHPYTVRSQSHDILTDGFTVDVKAEVMHGINVEYCATGCVWTRGTMHQGTFDSHRALPFDYVRTDIDVANTAASWPGGSKKANPYTGRRATHWNIRIKDSDRPEAERAIYINHPRTFTYAALVGIQGGPVFDGDGIAMPAPETIKHVTNADDGVVPDPANLYDMQLALRREKDGWVRLASPSTGIAAPGDITLSAEGGPAGGGSVKEYKFLVDGEVVGTAEGSKPRIVWKDAPAGEHTVVVEATDDAGKTLSSSATRLVVGTRRRVQETDPAITYVGEKWETEENSAFDGGSAKVSKADDSSIEFPFTGTRVRLFTFHNNNSQHLKFYIDDMETPVDEGTVHGGQAYYDYLGWDSGPLPAGPHVLRIEAKRRLLVDYLEVVDTSGTP
jgi:hypothetical protein